MSVTNNNLVNDIDNETVTDWQIYLIYLFQQDYFPKSDMVKHELRVASYEFRVESLKARVEGLKAQVEIKSAISNPRVTSSKPRVTSSNLWIIKSIKTQLSSLKSSSFPKILRPKLFGNSWGNWYFPFLVIISCFTLPLLHGYGFNRNLSE